MKVLIQFEKNPLLFRDPVGIISCYDPGRLRECFDEIEKALSAGYFVAGFLSYEAGYCFEDGLRDEKHYDFPLAYMGVYQPPQRRPPSGPKTRTAQRPRLRSLRLNISRDDYFKNIAAIRDHIAKGDVYQITYCIKFLFDFQGEPLTLYNRLLREQPVPYPAYLESDRFHILSLSPEMFIKKKGEFAATKPMKGTWPRGRHFFSDLGRRAVFQYDKKNRAENVMIADLLRNDLGRVGMQIRAPKLFEVAGYKKLFQMTSTVTGKIEKDI
ncbi:MAG: chorismate-binding protein, partial [Candidatus Omnitrophota bacterium]